MRVPERVPAIPIANRRTLQMSGNGSEVDGADEPLVFIIIGEVRREAEAASVPFHALLSAPDDDTAVRNTLEALAQEGYQEADLHQIGNLEGQPDEEPHMSAYESALEGEIAIIAYEGGYDFPNPTVIE